MSKIFWGIAELGPDGKPKLSLGSEANRARFSDFLRKNLGIRIRMDPYTPESKKQRGFFEGALVPFIAYFQENIDWNDSDDLHYVREGLKNEFNSTYVTIGDKAIKVAKSTKGELSRGLIERILDWAGEQGYPIELLNTVDYKNWKAKIFPFGGPPTYIEYLIETGKLLPRLEYKTDP